MMDLRKRDVLVSRAEVFPDAIPIPAESQETELQRRRVEQGLPVANCGVIFAHGYLGSRFEAQQDFF